MNQLQCKPRGIKNDKNINLSPAWDRKQTLMLKIEKAKMQRINQEYESTYIVYSNFHRDHITSFVSCPGIVVFAECHNVDTFRTEGWSHRRRRSSFPSLQSQLNHPRHCNSQEKRGQKKKYSYNF